MDATSQDGLSARKSEAVLAVKINVGGGINGDGIKAGNYGSRQEDCG